MSTDRVSVGGEPIGGFFDGLEPAMMRSCVCEDGPSLNGRVSSVAVRDVRRAPKASGVLVYWFVNRFLDTRIRCDRDN